MYLLFCPSSGNDRFLAASQKNTFQEKTLSLIRSETCRPECLRISLLNQRLISNGGSHRLRYQRQVTDTVSVSYKKEVLLHLLSDIRWKLQRQLDAIEPSDRNKHCFRLVAQHLLNTLTATINNIERATSLQQIREIVRKLENVIIDSAARIQQIASPPLLSKFVTHRSSIFLQITNRETVSFPVNQTQISSRLQSFIEEIDQLKQSDAGTLSANVVRRLKSGFDERKRHLSIAKAAVAGAKNNEEISEALRVLKKSILQSDRILASILKSPQQNFLTRLFAFLGELRVFHHDLGTAPTAS